MLILVKVLNIVHATLLIVVYILIFKVDDVLDLVIIDFKVFGVLVNLGKVISVGFVVVFKPVDKIDLPEVIV